MQSEKMDLKQISNSEEFVMRPLDIKQDYEELIPFYDLIFERELTAKGTSIRATLEEFKSFMPLFKIMGIFSKNFRHVFDGFVFENNEGKIVSTVNIGFSGDFWEIAMVATHPDYRRKGLAKKLIIKSLDHAKQHKAKKCVLEVLEENEPAYKLYRNMGFNHFDTKVKMRLDKEKISDIKKIELPQEYTIQQRKQDKKTSLAMLRVEEKATPDEVLHFMPVNKIKYQKTLMMRMLRPIFKLIAKSKARRWTIHFGDKIVGILYADVGRRKDSCHNIDVIVDPEYEKKLTSAMIGYALNYINKNSIYELNTITEVRKSNSLLLEELQNYGFVSFETDHLLALKMDK